MSQKERHDKMSDQKPKLKWKNCTSCQFPTECRREDLPERGCIKARTVWLCAVCAHSEVGALVRDPLRHFGEWYGQGGAILKETVQQRRDAAWQTNFLAAILLAVPRQWQMLESLQRLVDVEAVNEELDADLAAIKAAREEGQ